MAVYNRMKKIIMIIFLLPPVLADPPTYDWDKYDEVAIPNYDWTEFHINTLREIILLFKQAFGKNLYEELFPHNRTMKTHSEIINFKNLQIAFEIFPTEDDMFFLYADAVSCKPRKHLLIKLKQKKNGQDRMMKVTGNLKYLRSENSTQTCGVFFGLKFEFLRIKVEFHHVDMNETYKTGTDLKVTEWKEHSCDDIDEEQRRVIRENTLQAMIYWIENKLFATQLPFRSIRAECEHLQEISNDMSISDAVYLKPNRTTSISFWNSNYCKITIRGFKYFNLHMHQFEDTVQYEIEFFNTLISWTFEPFSSEEFHLKPHHITMNGNCKEFTVGAFNIKLHDSQLYPKDTNNNNTPPKEQVESLEALIAYRIDQELQNNSQSDVTISFMHTIREILNPRISKPFKNAFYDDGRGTVYFSNIQAEVFQKSNVKYINCLFRNSLQVDALNYKKITAHVNSKYYADNKTEEVSALLEIKNFNFTSHNLLLDTMEIETEIEHNFIIANKTITILSKQSYQKKDRISIGRRIFESFVKVMKDQIIDVAKSFGSVSKVCRNPMQTIQRLHPHYQQNRKKYYILIPSDWIDVIDPFTTRFVKIIINGSWNFKYISMEYNGEEDFVFYDLLMENVAGSIEQSGVSDPDAAVQLNFTVKCLSIKVNCTNHTVWAEVPDSKQFFITSNTLHSNSSPIRTNAVMEKFQQSVASFIERITYDDLNWYRKMRNLINQTVMETTRNESPPHYDISSVFLENFVETLLHLHSHLKRQVYRIDNHHLKDANDIFDEMKRLNESSNHTISLSNVGISAVFPIARKEACELPNHPQVIYNITLQLKGMAAIMNNSNFVLAHIFFIASNHSMMVTFKSNSNGEFRYDIVCENVEVQLEHPAENIYKYIRNEENDLKNKLGQISIAIMKTKLEETFQSWFSDNDVIDFCKLPHIATNDTFFDFLNDSQRYFYSINNIVAPEPQEFFIYHINLHDLFNFKLLSLQNSEKQTKFEFEMRKLTAHIGWNYVLNDFTSMKAETMDVQIEAIILIGTMIEETLNLKFSDQSTLLLSSNQGNVEGGKALTEKLKKMIMFPIQNSIRNTYRNKMRSRDWPGPITIFPELPESSTYQDTPYHLKHPVNSIDDMTALEIISLREAILIFKQAFGRNLLKELFSHNQTMEISSAGIMNLKNFRISFGIFATNDDVFFLHTDDIECKLHTHLQITLKQKKKEWDRMMKVKGNLKYLRSRNSTQTCGVFFALEFEFLRIKVEFGHVDTNDTYDTSADPKVTEWNEYSCDDINEKQRQFIREKTLRLLIDQIAKTLLANSELPFQSIREKCEQSQNKFGRKGFQYFVRLRPEYNAATFPWKSNYNDIMIRGLQNFALHMYHFEDAVQYEIEFRGTTISWLVASIFSQQFIFNSRNITMNGTFKEFIDNAFNIKLHDGKFYLDVEKKKRTASTERIKNLEALIALGIDKKLRITDDKQRDGTTIFQNILDKIMKTLGQLAFKNPPHNDRKKGTYFSNIEAEVFNDSNLKYVKCLFNDSLEISALEYKKMTAHANLQYHADNEVKEVSAFLELKLFNFTSHNLLLDTNRIEAEIARNFNSANKTITILSNYRYQRRDRILIGKNIFESFVKEMKHRIISFAKLIRPISDICTDPMNELRSVYPSDQQNRKKYYISILSDWVDNIDPFTSRFIEIIINGLWNLKSVKLVYKKRYDYGALYDLLMENVTGSIRQIGVSGPDTAVQLNFTVKSLSIYIDRESDTVSAKVPESKQFFITSNTLQSNSSPIRRNAIMKKFQQSIESFIEQIIYSEELATQTVMEATRNESPPQYDISSVFVEKFVKTLHHFHGHLKKQVYRMNNHHLKDVNAISDEIKRLNESSNHTISLRNVRISLAFPIAREEICESRDHPQVIYNTSLKLEGMATITNNSNFVLAHIIFSTSNRSAIFTFKSDSNGEFQFDVVCENMEVELQHPTKNIYKYVTNEENDLKSKLEQISIALIKTKLREPFQSWFSNDDVINFCKLPHTISAKETYFDLLDDSRRYFYSIMDTIEYINQECLTYHIRLYGLFNFKSLNMQNFEKETIYEFVAKNLTARIVWNHVLFELPSTKVKTMDVQIKSIVLKGKITDARELYLFRESTLVLFPNQGNIEEQKTLTENLKNAVLKFIEKSIKAEYKNKKYR